MIIVPGAGNTPSGKVYVRPTHEVLKRFRSRLATLIDDASLSPNERDNIDRLIDREQKMVFVDCKATMDERLNYWKKRRMSDSTRSFVHGMREARERWDAQYLAPLVRWGVSLIPPEGRSDIVEHQLWDIARAFSERRNREQFAVQMDFRAYVQERFVPEVKNQLRSQILRELAVEKARKESIEKARHYKRG